jgi:hypothetical protein|tara:strand:- start:4294 stop:4593 length:300 start_codon:yes stop_codon:yes gene_type:complete
MNYINKALNLLPQDVVHLSEDNDEILDLIKYTNRYECLNEFDESINDVFLAYKYECVFILICKLSKGGDSGLVSIISKNEALFRSTIKDVIPINSKIKI